MNLHWITQINLLQEQTRKELQSYYKKRSSSLIAAIKDEERVKQQAYKNAKKALDDAFNKYKKHI